MNVIISFFFLAVGLTGIFRPGYFYKSELLTPQQIDRNKRIWKWGGVGLTIVGLVLLGIQFLWK